MILPYFQGVVASLDRELVGRRALDQAVAIEAWKIGHDGEYPKTLEALVPGLLVRLPLDPYSGKPFGYVRSEGQPVGSPFLSGLDTEGRLRITKVGQPLLYSVGPNLSDERGRAILNSNQVSDIVFAIP